MKKVLLLIFLMAGISLSAQEGWEGGLVAGGSWYLGDLKPDFSFDKPGVYAAAIGRYNFNARITADFSIAYQRIRGDDTWSQNSFQQLRNLSFRSSIIEGTAAVGFNFLPYTRGSVYNYWTPYVFLGINVYHYNPKAEYEGRSIALQPLGTEGQGRGDEYLLTQLGVVYGGGFKVALSYRWSLNVILTGRALFHDYLDDVSTTYPDFDQLLIDRGQIAVNLSDRSLNEFDLDPGTPGRQRGNETTDDTFFSAGIGFVYYFGTVQCPYYTRPNSNSTW